MYMNILFILCHHNKPDYDFLKLFLTFAGSLSIALTIYYLNRSSDKNKQKVEKIHFLKSEIFVICEKILRYAIHSSQRELAVKKEYAINQVDKSKIDFLDVHYAKNLSDAEDSALKVVIFRADLIQKIAELELFAHTKEEITLISELKNRMKKESLDILKRFDGCFVGLKTVEEIEIKYKEELTGIYDYTFNKSTGKFLIEIQELIYPTMKIPRESR